MTASGLRELLAGETLSAREVEMLDAAAAGECARETGERLYLSPETIRFHRKSVIAKLDAKNMTHAVATAIRAGLIE